MDIRHTGQPQVLTVAAKALYELCVTKGSVATADAVLELGLTDKQATEAIDALKSLGLIRADSRSPSRWSAVAPDSARIQVLGPLLRRMQETQGCIDRIREDLDELAPLYERSMDQVAAERDTETVTELDVALRLITEFSASAAEEVLTSQPGGARPEQVLEESLGRTEALLARQVRLRTLYQHTAQFHQTTIAYVERVTAMGAEVRTTAPGFARMLIFDRSIAVLPLLGSQEGAVVVRNASVVAALAEAFERTWNGATPFPLEYSRHQAVQAATEVRRTIIGLLVQGETDKKIAQSVGLSLRSTQRHIAEVMQDLGARNRLHAGYLLHGLTA
ncbi:LuxR C-terminal-related transcriptional regulator [Kitasatospora sp. NPDC057904]|uniref:LuxR C-terminal-related transcriptional regulator n=1 Tax=Kitasatospora sp. NPDC057904 TaxID=3346275 RepID=UPI0036D78BDD